MRRSAARRAVSRVNHRGLNSADVFLASYPRSGNTWTSLMLAELLGHKFDPRSDRWPVSTVGAHRDAPALLLSGGRLIKTHEQYRPEYRRAIYLLRDPRDVALSLWRMRGAAGFRAQPLDGFLREFFGGRIGGWGSWQDHVTSWHAADYDGAADVLVIRYEDLLDDPVNALARMIEFLGLDLRHERLRAVAETYADSRIRNASGDSDDGPMVTGRIANGRWRQEFALQHQTPWYPAADVMQRMGYEIGGHPA